MVGIRRLLLTVRRSDAQVKIGAYLFIGTVNCGMQNRIGPGRLHLAAGCLPVRRFRASGARRPPESADPAHPVRERSRGPRGDAPAPAVGRGTAGGGRGCADQEYGRRSTDWLPMPRVVGLLPMADQTSTRTVPLLNVPNVPVAEARPAFWV